MSELQLAEKVDIRAAKPSDVERIFALATSLFGDKQFLYTIYQAPQAVRHLAKVVHAADPRNPIAVLKLDDYLLGYYEALVRDSVCFLNYIGVDLAWTGEGYGRRLLAHFTGMAHDLRCSALALDVFESNPRALRWYEHTGFSRQSSKWFTRFGLDASAVPSTNTLFDTNEWNAALEEESERGFSKVSCRIGEHAVLLGLIGGHSCKILECNSDLEPAVESIAMLVKGMRKFLIVASGRPLTCHLPLASSEIVVRMRKALD